MMKSKFKLFATGLLLGSFHIGCARITSNPNLGNRSQGSGNPVLAGCSLDGAWTRCQASSASSSVKVYLSVSGNTFSETIYEFNSNDSCSGIESSAMSFDAQVSVGAIGSSSTVPGGTNVDLTPSVDIFGCGLGQPSFTAIKFANECQNFYSVVGTPSCNAANRPNALDPQPFNRL